MQAAYLAAAREIGDRILKDKKIDANGTYWMNYDVVRAGSFIAEPRENLYNGNAGILLFLLELHQATGDAALWSVIEDGNRWLEHYCQEHEPSHYALYLGRASVVWYFIRLAEVTGQPLWLEKAVKLLQPVLQSQDTKLHVDDFISGRAGLIWVIARLLQALQAHMSSDYEAHEKALFSFLDQQLNLLLGGTFTQGSGVCWDRHRYRINGLCGLSHGASGIGMVLFQLSKALQNEHFSHLARASFIYENQWFCPQNGWKDLRKLGYTARNIKEMLHQLRSNNRDFFQPETMNAWCNGAPGIGLTRVRAYQMTGDSDDLADVHRAIAIINQRQPKMSYLVGEDHFNLCHGDPGDAILFLEAYHLTKDETYLEVATAVADAIIQGLKTQPAFHTGLNMKLSEPDHSLMVGHAGVGYFFLRMHDFETTPSILAPQLLETPLRLSPELALPTLRQNASDWQLQQIQKHYPSVASNEATKVFIAISQILSDSLSVEGQNPNLPPWEKHFQTQMRQALGEEASEQTPVTQFNKDCRKRKTAFKLSNLFIYSTLEFFRSDYLEQWQTFDGTTKDQQVIIRHPLAEPFESEHDDKTFVFIPQDEKVAELELNDLSQIIWHELEQPKSLLALNKSLAQQLETTPEQADQLSDLLHQQIEAMIGAGLLWPEASATYFEW
jgi:hypothetical protein